MFAKTIFKQIINALHETSNSSYEARWLTLALSSRIAQADISLHAYQRATAQLQAIMPDVYKLQNDALVSACLEMLSILSTRAGNFDEARQLLIETLDAARHIDKLEDTIVCQIELAWVLTDLGNFGTAEESLADALSLNEQLEDFRLSALLALAQGRLAEAKSQLTRAEKFYGRSIIIFSEIDDRANLSIAQTHLARIAKIEKIGVNR